jgi:hypothetical protein
MLWCGWMTPHHRGSKKVDSIIQEAAALSATERLYSELVSLVDDRHQEFGKLLSWCWRGHNASVSSVIGPSALEDKFAIRNYSSIQPFILCVRTTQVRYSARF